MLCWNDNFNFIAKLKLYKHHGISCQLPWRNCWNLHKVAKMWKLLFSLTYRSCSEAEHALLLRLIQCSKKDQSGMPDGKTVKARCFTERQTKWLKCPWSRHSSKGSGKRWTFRASYNIFRYVENYCALCCQELLHHPPKKNMSLTNESFLLIGKTGLISRTCIATQLYHFCVINLVFNTVNKSCL